MNATIEEAIANAGSTVLSHLGSRAHKLTVDEVRQWEEDNPRPGVYAGPYNDEADDRNSWTAFQGEPTAPAAAKKTAAQPSYTAPAKKPEASSKKD